MSDVVIRDSSPADAAALAAIWLETTRLYAQAEPERFQVAREEGLVEWMRAHLGAPRPASKLDVVAERAGTVAGYLVAWVRDPVLDAPFQLVRDIGRPRLEVQAIGVAPRAFRTGVGTALMRHAEHWGRERGAEICTLDTSLDSPMAVPFYEKRLGYRRASVIFWKKLT